jgi:OmpA-OmpF porin, OOP family
MKHLSRFGFCAVLLVALASCQSFEGAFSVDKDMEAGKMAGPPSGAFDAALQQEYNTVAQREYDEADWEHAGLFGRKAAAAGNGESVMPENPADWMLPADKETVFTEARDSLMAALDGGGREMAPKEAAIAQANYDCWIQEQEIKNEGFQDKDIAYCRGNFWDNLALVEKAIAPKPMAEPEPTPPPAPEPVARDYLVYFDFDKYNVRADAASILDRVADAINEMGATTVRLIGHTDTMGTPEYNQVLSVERADSVQDYLKKKGVTAKITATGVGESDPRVPTPDQVAEQENRNVQIRIE